jgi:hypothetical protein
MQTDTGDTPLLLSCLRERKRPSLQVIELLARQCPEVIGIGDNDGNTPLHFAVRRGRSHETIQLMIDLNPAALRVVDTLRRTELHYICYYGASLELIRVIAVSWPLASLLLDNENNSPYDDAVYKGRETPVLRCLVETMRDAAHSLIGDLGFKQVHDMISRDNLPFLIKDESFRNLLFGIETINTAGRNYIQDDPTNKLQGVRVLKAVVDNLDCLFLHLRESPLLFGGRPRQENLKKRKCAALQQENVELPDSSKIA